MKYKDIVTYQFCAQLGKDYLDDFEKLYGDLSDNTSTSSYYYNVHDRLSLDILNNFFDNHFVNVTVQDKSLFELGYRACFVCAKNPFYTMKNGERIFISGADHTDFYEEYVFWMKMKHKIDSSSRPVLRSLSERINFRLYSLRKILEDKGDPKFMHQRSYGSEYNRFESGENGHYEGSYYQHRSCTMPSLTIEEFIELIDKKGISSEEGKEMLKLFKRNFAKAQIAGKTRESLEEEYKLWLGIIRKISNKFSGPIPNGNQWNYLRTAVVERRKSLQQKINEMKKNNEVQILLIK